MSRLDELIQEYCPDGVEYKKLGEIATITRGGNLQKKDFQEIGIPCIHYGQIYTRYGLTATETFSFISEECAVKQKYAEPGDIVMAVTSENVEDVCKCVVWLGDDKVAVSGHTAIIHHHQNPRYLSYYLHTEMFANQKMKFVHGTKVMEVTPNKLVDIIIPVPPLPVQEEIVRILDSFTELTAELQAELQARKKQYEYYSSHLLFFGEDVEWQPLGEIAEITDYVANGSFASLRENVSYKNEPDYAVLIRTADYSSGFNLDKMVYIDKHAYNFLNKSKLYGGEIIINNIGAGVGTTFRCPNLGIPMSLAPNSVMVKTKNDAFYYYWFNSKYGQAAIQKIVGKSAMPKFNKTGLRSIKVPVPSVKEQNHIVSILDRFDTLCNDISSGLPAEIEARQKQYEYFRDKLLTFKPLS